MLFRSALVCIILSTLTGMAQEARPRVELESSRGMVTIVADGFERTTAEQIVAAGDVQVDWQDARLTADRMTYTPSTEQLEVEGNIELTRGKQWLKAERAEIDLSTETGVLHQVQGFTDEELFVSAQKLTRVDEDTYIAEDGFLTACEDSVPKWSFTIDRATIHLNRTARLAHTLFKIKQVPVFYLPYLLFPTGSKERSSGFMLPTTGNSNNKGRRISQSIYVTLGRSADLMLHEDYFSQRGFGHGFTLRTRPRESIYLELDGYLIDDRMDQGGAALNGMGEARFENGFRAVTDFNLVSNFVFRQVFSDDFEQATRPSDDSRFFLTNNFGSASFNLAFSREETSFPGPNTILHSTPEIVFLLNGMAIPGTPFFLELDSSVGGYSRSDALIETPRISQRFDVFPRVYFSVPLFQDLKLTPLLGVRNTHYGDSLVLTEEGAEVTGEDLNRQYLDLQVVLEGWGLSRVYQKDSARAWKHLIEPQVRYRYLGGIEQPQQVILFDEVDAIGETNEIAYGLVNRIFVKDGALPREWLTVKIFQKHYFQPAFGGLLEPGEVNQFYPLNTLTGIPYATGLRDFSPVSAEARFTPTARYSFDVRADFDSESGEARNFSLTGSIHRRNLLLGTTYFWTSELFPELGKSNQLQAHLGLGNFNRGFSISSRFSYDAVAERFLNFKGRANYYWDCCGVTFEFQNFNIGLRQERQFRFSFFLKGIGNFGTIKRPDRIF